MDIGVDSGWVLAVLLLTLRLTPVFAFAPPFTLLNVPVRVRAFVPLMLAVCLLQVPGTWSAAAPPTLDTLPALAASEALIGLGLAFALQASFAALQFAGRVLDVQSGFGLATVLDPASRAQSPLVGTLFVLGAAAVFFAVDGHHDLMRAFAATLEAVPVGALVHGWPLEAVIAHAGLIFVLGVVAGGAGMVVLFMTDVALGFLSRTLPQMNILVLGLQVKTVVLVLTLVALSGLMPTVFLRVAESSLRFIARLEP